MSAYQIIAVIFLMALSFAIGFLIRGIK